MPLVLPGVDEPTFNKLTQRFHRALIKRAPAVSPLVSLGQLRETLVEAMGHRSLHDARQVWQAPRTSPAPAWRLPESETYDRLEECPALLFDDARGCDYQGHEFGATYPDSLCIEGWLWDADSGENGQVTSGGEQPCPWCNHREWVVNALEAIEEKGWEARDKGLAREANPYPLKTRFHHLGEVYRGAWWKGWDSWNED